MRAAMHQRGLARAAAGVRGSPRVPAACDVYRPAAIEQLAILGKSVDVDVLLMAMSIMVIMLMTMTSMTMSSMTHYGAASWP